MLRERSPLHVRRFMTRHSISATVAVVVVALVAPPTAAQSSPALAPSELRSLSADEVTVLTPIARNGVAILGRDLDAGVRAQTTMLTRTRAPLQTVHDVIAAPEHYGEFMDGIDRTEIQSRFQNRVAFRMHTTAGIFSSDTVGSIHIVNAHRIDGRLSQSQLGPADLRWDLYPDGDGTLIALTTRGDPSQVNWFLRALTRGDASSIAGIQMAYNGIVLFAVALRAEIRTGNGEHTAFEHVDASSATAEPPSMSSWSAILDDNVVIGAVVLDAGRDAVGSTVAMRSATTTAALRARLSDVESYPRTWSMVRSATPSAADAGNALRFRSSVDSTLFHTEGDQERTEALSENRVTLRWHGASGDYAGIDHRWDLVPAARGGTVVVLTGGREQQGAGLVMRTVFGMAHWIVAGYSVAWKMLWVRPLATMH